MQPNNLYDTQATGQPIENPQPLLPQSKNKPHFGLVIGLLLSLFLLVISLVFGFWAYQQMLDYKLNSDKKSASAVEVAKEEQRKELEAEFAEQEKSPLKNYTSPSQYGSVRLEYPKTWSAYIVEQTSTGNSTPIDGYFYPNFVPNISTNEKTNYSLRIQIVNQSYKTVLDGFKQLVSTGKITATPFTPKLVKGASVGTRLDGQLQQNKNGSIVVLPLRDKVLKIWTENDSNVNDFNNLILAKLTYIP